MKYVNSILAFLTKKGSLFLGFVLGFLVAFIVFFPVSAYAEDIVTSEESGGNPSTESCSSTSSTEYSNDPSYSDDSDVVYEDLPDNYKCLIRGTWWYSYNKSFDISSYFGLGDPVTDYACYVSNPKSIDTSKGTMTTYDYTIIHISQVTDDTTDHISYLCYMTHDNKTQRSVYPSSNSSAIFTSVGFSAIHAYVGVPIFKDRDTCLEYLRGNIPLSDADNYDDIEPKDEYDLSLPFYDKASIEPVDSNNFKMRFIATMNSKNVKEVYNLNDEGYQYYYTLESYGIYMKSDVWTSMCRIFEQVGLSSKFSSEAAEHIKIDSTGRLIVDSAHSGGGGRHSGKLFSISSGQETYIYSVEMSDTVTSKDKMVADTYFSKVLSATPWNGGSVNNILTGVNGGAQLIGYYTIIQPYIIKDGKVVYAKPTYTYNWCYKSLRDSVGTGGYSYDPQNPDGPVDPVDPVKPDPDPDDPVDPDPVDPSSFDLVSYVKQCFVEAKSFVLVFSSFFASIPAMIWTLIITALTLNLVVIVLKVLRGM